MYIPGIGGTATVRSLVADVRVFVLVTKLESQVIDNVAGVIDNVSALSQVALDGLAANLFESDDGIGVGGGGETGQNALLSQEQRAGTDGKEGASGRE